MQLSIAPQKSIVLLAASFLAFCPVWACGDKPRERVSIEGAPSSVSPLPSNFMFDPSRIAHSESWMPSEERLAQLDQNTGIVLMEIPLRLSRYSYSVSVGGRSKAAEQMHRGSHSEIEVPLNTEIQVRARALGYQMFYWSGRLDAQQRFIRVEWTPVPDTEFSNSLGYRVIDLPEESGGIRETPQCGGPKSALFDIVTYPVHGYAMTFAKYPYLVRGCFVDTEGVVWRFEGDEKGDLRYIRIARVLEHVLAKYKQLMPAAAENISQMEMHQWNSHSFFSVRMHLEPSEGHILGEPVIELDWVRKDYSVRRNVASEEIVKWMLAVYLDTGPHENYFIR